MHYRVASPQDAAAIAAVHVSSWRSTYVGLLPDELLSGLSTETRTANWRRQLEAPPGPDKTFICIAEDAGRIVGFASAGAEREPDSGFEGELFAIYLLAESQGKGVGRALVRRVVNHLRKRGYVSMRVWVLAGNPAERFYQRLGGLKVGEKAIEIDAVDYQEVAYGWPELSRVQTG